MQISDLTHMLENTYAHEEPQTNALDYGFANIRPPGF